MDVDKIMVGKKEKKTEYITPYKDSGIGCIVNLKVLGVLWTLMLFLKVLCQDEEWSFFLMFTALLLLFILPFFITKEVVRDEKFAGFSGSLTLPSPPTFSVSSDVEEPSPDSTSITEKEDPLAASESSSETSALESVSSSEDEKKSPQYALLKMEDPPAPLVPVASESSPETSALELASLEDEKTSPQYALLKMEDPPAPLVPVAAESSSETSALESASSVDEKKSP